MARPKTENPKISKSVRLTELVAYKAQTIAMKKGYGGISDYLRVLLMNDIEDFEKQHGTISMG